MERNHSLRERDAKWHCGPRCMSLLLTAVFITIGPSGAFYTHGRTFGSHPGDGSEWFRLGAPLSLLEFPLTRHCRRPDITTPVCVKCGRGAYRYENSCKYSLRNQYESADNAEEVPVASRGDVNNEVPFFCTPNAMPGCL